MIRLMQVCIRHHTQTPFLNAYAGSPTFRALKPFISWYLSRGTLYTMALGVIVDRGRFVPAVLRRMLGNSSRLGVVVPQPGYNPSLCMSVSLVPTTARTVFTKTKIANIEDLLQVEVGLSLLTGSLA